MALENLPDLEEEWQHFLVKTNANGKATQDETWRKQNPGEWQKLQDYRADQTKRPSLTTLPGKRMTAHLSAWHKANATVPPPPTGNVIKVNGTISPANLLGQINAAPAGPVTVMPADGQVGFTVSGDLRLARPNVTFQKAGVRDVIADNQGDGFVFDGCTVHSFLLRSVDNWVIRNCQVPFNGVTYGPQQGFDVNGGSIMFACKNWQILDSTFTGAYVANNPGQHTEAWYIGGRNDDGLIKGCKFDNNGSTAHLFFTWWDSQANPPKNICVTDCDFTRSRNPYFHICVHPDIAHKPLGIKFDVATCTFDSGTSYKIGNEYGELTDWNGSCG